MVQNPQWLNSTFQELSNEYSHAQIRVKMKKLWPRQVGEEKQVAVKKVCRDRNCVATNVATSSMSRPSKLSRPVSRQAVCRDQCRDKQYIVTSVATKQYVATSVATSSISRPVSKPSKLSRPVSRQAVCRDQCRDQKALSRQESFVATRNAKKPKNKPKFDILT